MTYPVANFTTPVDMVVYASTVTNTMFWPLILVAIFIVMFAGLAAWTTTERAFATTAFFNGVLAGFLWLTTNSEGIHALDTIPTVISFALAIVGFIMLLFTKD